MAATIVSIVAKELGLKLNIIKAKISEIIASTSNYMRIEKLGEEGPPFRRLVLPNIDNLEVVGFEDKKRNIIDTIVNGSSADGRQVISIVGPRGLGKTTLAKEIYNDGQVKSHFTFRIWLPISRTFKPIDILNRIYREAYGVESNGVQGDEVHLSEKINELLREKKYLIILDDVWDENVFSFLEAGFPDVQNGSRVLITTRVDNVAKCTSYINDTYKLPYLKKDEGLLLFIQKAFRNGSVHYPDELKDLNEQLAERCHGLPLAICILGGLFSRETPTKIDWSRLANKMDWHVDAKEFMENILAFGYNELPNDLKFCFRYLANFPEDFAISTKSLTRMWIAEGFITNKTGVLEDDAENYLDELAQRCLIQVHSRCLNGKIKEITVHDLLRDLAIKEAQECDFLLICQEDSSLSGNLDAPSRVVLPRDHTVEPGRLEKINMHNLHSFIQFVGYVSIGLGFLLLRVLELQGSQGVKLPHELKNMIHLRYLGLAMTDTDDIPDTIGCLKNLQTLDIRETSIDSLPYSLWKIPTLRHVMGLHFDGPPASANLVNLQTLKYCHLPMSWKRELPLLPRLRALGIAVCKEENEEDEYGDHGEWAQRWQLVTNLLKDLTDLRQLRLIGHHIPSIAFDARTSPCYQNLQSLKLYGFHTSRLSFGDVQIPRNLIKLIINGFHFEQDPIPTLEKLRCLQILYMISIKGVSRMVCSAKGFPQLKQLHVSLFAKLNEWDVKEEAMPMLNSLLINDCDKLRVLPDLQQVTTLKELHLYGMPDEFMSRIQDSEENQKINHVPNIYIKEYGIV